MSKNTSKDPAAECLQSAQILFDDFADLWDENSAKPLKQELERLQKNYSTVSSVFRNTGEDNLKVAVVGSFSCGKSSFINSILEDEVAPVEIKPMTHGVTSFIYGETEKYDADGKEISREEYQAFVQDANNDTKHFIVSYPCERLKKLEFMDSPGFGSVSEGDEEQDEKAARRDNELCDDSIARADVVFFLSNITEGVIPNDAFKRLKEICNPAAGVSNPNRRIYIILTWADRKTESQREDIRNSIIQLCESEKLNICDYRVYSSMPLEKMKEKHREFFSNAREELFATVRNLQVIGSELMSYRKGFDGLIFNLHLQQFSEKLQLEIPAIKKNIGSAEKLKERLKDNLCQVAVETIDAVCDILEDKFAENKPWLIHDEKKVFTDDIVSVVILRDFVTLSVGEIFAVTKAFLNSGKRNGFDLNPVLQEDDLKLFFASDTSDGDFPEGSLADAYLNICVSLLNAAGGPWEKYLFGADEREAFIQQKLKAIKNIFDKKFRSEIQDVFCGPYFFPAIEKAVIQPQLDALENRIKSLSAVKKQLVYKAAKPAPKNKSTKSKENKKKTNDLSVDDMFDML